MLKSLSKVEEKEALISSIIKHDPSEIFTYKNVAYQNATINDIPDMMKLEKEWPKNLRASEDQITRRVEMFPEGAVIAREILNTRDDLKKISLGDIIGMITSQRIMLNPNETSKLPSYSWDYLTDNGNTTKMDHNGNTADLIGLIVSDKFRGRQIGTILFLTAIKSIALLNTPAIEVVTTNVRLPEFRKTKEIYRQKNNHELSVKEYIALFRDVDPVLKIHCVTGGGDVIGWDVDGQRGDLESVHKGARIDHSRTLAVFKNQIRSLNAPTL